MRSARLLAIALLALPVTAGCASTSSDGQPAALPASGDDLKSVPITNTDACAMRLHDISGNLLLFELQERRMPDSLDELASMTGGPELPELVCPVSGRPYVYRRDAVYLQDQNAYVVLHDPAPSHSRIRWAVTYAPAAGAGVPTMKVVGLPESFFLLNPPR